MKMQTETERKVLHIFGSLDAGGAESRTMDIYRNIISKKIQFDFIVLSKGEHHFTNEVKTLGGEIFSIRHPRENIFGHIIDLFKVMKTYNYVAVHSHTSFHSGLCLLLAKISKIPLRIAHSRTTSTNKNQKNVLKKISIFIGRLLISLFANKYIAISNSAARFLFFKHDFDKVQIIPNAIELENFRPKRLTNNYKTKDNKLRIGHVGRFAAVKNHDFLVDLANDLRNNKILFEMTFVGDGELKSVIQNRVKEEGLEDNISFAGVTYDIANQMEKFDLFLFPSLYEGLGGAVIEAQASGIKSIVSDTLPTEVDLNLDLVTFLPLEKDLWINKILADRQSYDERKDFENISEKFNLKGYDIKTTVEKWSSIYGSKG